VVHQQNINWTFEIYLFIFSKHTNQAFNQTRGNYWYHLAQSANMMNDLEMVFSWYILIISGSRTHPILQTCSFASRSFSSLQDLALACNQPARCNQGSAHWLLNIVVLHEHVWVVERVRRFISLPSGNEEHASAYGPEEGQRHLWGEGILIKPCGVDKQEHGAPSLVHLCWFHFAEGCIVHGRDDVTRPCACSRLHAQMWRTTCLCV